jgi:NAD(P)-dependent dehydrogenase (short-subunit alcohol dehydrogenase family)
MGCLTNKIALVTGAASGIGLKTAERFAEEGASVVLADKAEDRLEEALASVRRYGGQHQAMVLDVTSEAAWIQTLERIDGTFGRLDILVNNAGGYYDHSGKSTDGDLTSIRGALDVNLLGAWSLTAAALPLMRRHGYGRVVNVSSECAVHAMCGEKAPAYRISKAALNAYTQVIARETQGSGILINAVCPGWTATDLGGAGGRPVAESAEGVVWAALVSEQEAGTGDFYRDRARIAW